MELETTWQQIPISERDRAYAIFHAMKDGDILELDKRVKPENREKFLTIVKYFIAHGEGKHLNFELTLNSDYSKVKKVKEVK